MALLTYLGYRKCHCGIILLPIMVKKSVIVPIWAIGTLFGYFLLQLLKTLKIEYNDTYKKQPLQPV